MASHYMRESKKNDYRSLINSRSYNVIKANTLVRARYSLSLQEQKALNFMISLIKPDDDLTAEKSFRIKDFCMICGIDYDGGANYKYIKSTIKELADKSVFVPVEGGGETLIRWISTVDINRNSGTVNFKFFEKIIPYLHQLKAHFTKYYLIFTLPMKSRYSLRIYELLKSYESLQFYETELDEFKKQVDAEKYQRYPDFRRYVLEPALAEINEGTELKVTCTPVTKGRKVVGLTFVIASKNGGEMMDVYKNIDLDLGYSGTNTNGQLTFLELLETPKGNKPE